MSVNDDRRPLFATTFPKIQWKELGKRLRIDPEIEQLAKYSVYRYATIAEAIALCCGNSMTFARPSSWPDKYESHITDSLFVGDGPYSSSTPYLKCFSVEYSSEAMWRTYASHGGLVRIGIGLPNLIKALDSSRWPAEGKIYVARARYMEQKDIRKHVKELATTSPKKVMNNAMAALTMKRAGFSFENEIRVGYFPAAKTNPPKTIDALDVPTKSITRVLVDPYLPDWQAKELVKLFKKTIGVTFPVKQSSFDSGPKDVT